MHPDNETLLAWTDGELTERSRRGVSEHLSSCGACRALLAEIEAAFRQFVATEVRQKLPAQLDEGLAPLVARMRKLKSVHRDTVQAQIMSRVAAELELFFGTPARSWVNNLKSTHKAGEGVLSAAEPVFAAVLGSKAAAALTSRIVENLDTEELLGESL